MIPLPFYLAILLVLHQAITGLADDGGCCPHGKLSVKGSKLVDKDNNPVQLRGMSLFWSNFPEGKGFFNEQTVQCLKCNWHADIVRAPLGVESNDNYLQNPDTELSKEDAIVDAAIKNCMYVLIDWHYTSSAQYKDKAVEFFRKMSAKCAGKCNCLYEDWNEPTQNDWASLKPYHEEVIKAIRENDKDGIVIAGTPTWDQDDDKVADDPIKDQTNVMYTLHFYAGEDSHKQPLRDKTEAAIKKGLPIFVTEYGTTPASGDGTPNLEETQKWYDFLDQNQISYINWAISNKPEQSAALQQGTGPADVCKDDKDTTSGAFVKKMLRAKNSTPQGCPAS